MKRYYRIFWKLCFIGFLVVLLFAIGYYNAHQVKITEVEIKSPDIPPAFDGIKIVFIADIHFGPFLSTNQLREIVEMINRLNPDLILLGGDYVLIRQRYIAPAFNELGKLRSPLGTYGVLGNRDQRSDPDLTKTKMKESGIICCDNKSYWIKRGGDSIKIGGVGDLWYDTQIPENTLRGLKKTDFAILLSHHPDYIENIHSDLIDLTLSGHTHGGQVTIFGWAPILPSEYGQKYRYGLIRSGNTQSYITSGVGTVMPPIRFFCSPEIVLLQLKRKKT